MNKFEQAKWILERNLHWIAAAEVKIGFIVTLDLAMLGALVGFYSNAYNHPLSLSCLLLATGLLVCSLLSATCSFRPRLNGPSRSVIFFGKISACDQQEYINNFNTLTEAELLNDLLQQIHRNAQIAAEKHKDVKNAISWALIALPFWGLAIIFSVVTH